MLFFWEQKEIFKEPSEKLCSFLVFELATFAILLHFVYLKSEKLLYQPFFIDLWAFQFSFAASYELLLNFFPMLNNRLEWLILNSRQDLVNFSNIVLF